MNYKETAGPTKFIYRNIISIVRIIKHFFSKKNNYNLILSQLNSTIFRNN